MNKKIFFSIVILLFIQLSTACLISIDEITSPSSNGYYNNKSIPMNFSITGSNISSCWYRIENMSGGSIDSIVIENTTITDCSLLPSYNNLTFGVPLSEPDYQSYPYEGIQLGHADYALTIFSNDTSNCLESYSKVFSVKTEPSIVTIQANYTYNGTAVNGLNISSYNSAGTFLKSALTDIYGNLTDWEFINYISSGPNVINTKNNNFTFNATKTGWNVNSQIINITDNYLSIQFNISDSIPPTITISQPENRNYNYNDSLPLNYSISDFGVGLDSCWYKVVNSSGYLSIGNTTIVNCQNTTFSLPEGNIDYTLTLYANDTLGNENSSSVNFGLRITIPSIVLNSPQNNIWKNGNNLYFNFTATDNSGLDTCKLFSNWSGSWIKNYTWVGPQSGVMNYTILNLGEGTSIWNIWCNNTAGTSDYALNNFTIRIDNTYPNISIDSIVPTQGSQTIYFNHTTVDDYLSSCKYSIFDSNNSIDGIYENITISCNSLNSQATVSAFGSYTLKVYARDNAGNENSSSLAFTTSDTETTSTGGSGTTILGKILVLAVIDPNDPPLSSALQRAIIYKEINKVNKMNIFFKTLKISELKKTLDSLGFTIQEDELKDWFEQYEVGNTDSVYVNEADYELFSLIAATGTYCGDGICQVNGNDLGTKEDYFSCSQDCEPANIDSVLLGCIDFDPVTSCAFSQQTYQYVGIGLGLIILVGAFGTIENKKTKKQIPIYRYVRVNLKKWKKL